MGKNLVVEIEKQAKQCANQVLSKEVYRKASTLLGQKGSEDVDAYNNNKTFLKYIEEALEIKESASHVFRLAQIALQAESIDTIDGAKECCRGVQLLFPAGTGLDSSMQESYNLLEAKVKEQEEMEKQVTALCGQLAASERLARSNAARKLGKASE